MKLFLFSLCIGPTRQLCSNKCFHPLPYYLIAFSHHISASFLLLFTYSVVSGPHTSSGPNPFAHPSTCFFSSGASKTTQFVTERGSFGFQRMSAALFGTR